jgi:RNA polymerase sigma-70 factor (ECF subfamily)
VVNGRVPGHDPTDAELAALVAGGDVAAFARLYDRYARPAYALAAHLIGPADAEEIIQDVFLAVWRKAAQFDPERGSFGAWFMAIPRHRVLEEVSRRRRQRPAGVEEVERLLARAPDPAPDVEEQAWRRERGEAAWQALAELPAEQRQVIVLAYFGGLSQTAIARHLSLPLGTVKKRTRLAFGKLRAVLAEPGTAPALDGAADANDAAPVPAKYGRVRLPPARGGPADHPPRRGGRRCPPTRPARRRSGAPAGPGRGDLQAAQGSVE